MATNQQEPKQPDNVPAKGTMAYAQYLRRQELAGNPESRPAGPPAEHPANQANGRPADLLPASPQGQPTDSITGGPEGRPGGSTQGSPTDRQGGRSIDPPASPKSADSVLDRDLPPLTEGIPHKKLTITSTDEEDEVLEEIKLQLRRQYRMDVTKNDIGRAAFRLAGRELSRRREGSALIRELKRR